MNHIFLHAAALYNRTTVRKPLLVDYRYCEQLKSHISSMLAVARRVCALAAVAAAYQPAVLLSSPPAARRTPVVHHAPVLHHLLTQQRAAVHMAQHNRLRKLSLPTLSARRPLKAIKHAFASVMMAVVLTGGGGVFARRADALAQTQPTKVTVSRRAQLRYLIS